MNWLLAVVPLIFVALTVFTVLLCYVLILKEFVGVIAKRWGHRLGVIGFGLVLTSIVMGLVWNSGSLVAVLTGLMIICVPWVRLIALVWSKGRAEYSDFELRYAMLLLAVGLMQVIPVLCGRSLIGLFMVH